MASKADYIAVFDSGVGGVSVLRELVRIMPGERFLYFGDSANAPYGSRDTEEVKALTETAVEHLMERGIKALVVACNTATAAAIDFLRGKYPDMIVIGIEPALKPAVTQFPEGTIGIMATPVTLHGEKLHRLLQKYPHPDIRLIPAPGMVELVEAGLSDSPQMDALLSTVLSDYAQTLDALVLGCTHYPFAIPAIRRVLGPKTVLFDGGAGTARQTKRRLREAGLLQEAEGCVIFENSLNNPEIVKLCKKLMEGRNG